jgi:hypothetical protein
MSTVRLKMLTVTSLISISPLFVEPNYITLFTAALQWSLNASHINPVHIKTYFLNINSNVILPSTSSSIQVVSSLQIFRLKFSMILLGPLLAALVVTFVCIEVQLVQIMELLRLFQACWNVK